MHQKAAMNSQHLLEDPVGKTLVRLAWPMIAGVLAVMTFNIVDTLFIGRLGADQLGAMGFSFPVTFIITSVAMGMGVGTSSVVSRAIGAGQYERVRLLATGSIFLSILLVTLAGSAGLVFLNPLFRVMGADEVTLSYIRQYMVPWFAGVGFLVVPMVGNAIIRATGDTRTPSYVMISAGVVNIILDPLLIFGIGPFPRLEVFGAALATVISWSFTFAASWWILQHREKLLYFRKHTWPAMWGCWREILHVGIPAALTNMLLPLSGAILTRMISSYGTEAVAGFGVGGRIETLGFIVFLAMATALAPFVGQNYGAARFRRVQQAARFSVQVCLGWGLLVWVAFSIGGEQLVSFFNAHEGVVSSGRLYLLIVPASYGCYGILLHINVMLNAMRHPVVSCLNMIVRLVVFVVPLAWIFERSMGLAGIYVGIALGNGLAALWAYISFNILMRRYDGTARVRSRACSA